MCVVTCTCTLFKQEFFPQNNLQCFSPRLSASTLPLIWRCCFSSLCARGHVFQMLYLFAFSQLFINLPYNFFHFEHHLPFLAFLNVEPTFSKASFVCELCTISFPHFLKHNLRLIFGLSVLTCGIGSISAKTAMGKGRPLCSYSLKV